MIYVIIGLLIIWISILSNKIYNLSFDFESTRKDFNCNFENIEITMENYKRGILSLAKELGYQFKSKENTIVEKTDEPVAIKIKKGKK